MGVELEQGVDLDLFEFTIFPEQLRPVHIQANGVVGGEGIGAQPHQQHRGRKGEGEAIGQQGGEKLLACDSPDHRTLR